MLFADLVRTYTSTTGTGPITPGAAVDGYRTFTDALSSGDDFYYAIEGVTVPTEFELGRGELQSNGTISRDPIVSSNGNALVNFSAGTKTIALTVAAEWYTQTDQAVAAAQSDLSRLAKAIVVADVAGDGVTDDRPAIQAALDDPNNSIVFLPAGTIGVQSNIIVPSGKSLIGAGRHLTTIKALDGWVAQPGIRGGGGAIVYAIDTSGVTLRDFLIDGSKIGTHFHVGTLMFTSSDFVIERVDVKDVSAYAHWVSGDLGPTIEATTFSRYGTYRDCRTENCNVHFEQVGADTISVIDCKSTDGDADIGVETYFHCYGFSTNIAYVRPYVRDTTDGAAVEITSASGEPSQISIIDPDFECSGTGYGLLVTGDDFRPIDQVTVYGGHMVTGGGPAVYAIYCTKLSVFGTMFSGDQVCISIQPGTALVARSASATVSTSNPAVTIFGLILQDSTGSIDWDGAIIAEPGVGGAYAYSGAPILWTQRGLVYDAEFNEIARTGPTLPPATNTNQLATTAFVQACVAGKQDANANLAAITALAPAAGQLIYWTGATTAAVTGISAFGRSLIDDADAATARATIGAEPAIAAGTTSQYWRGDKSWQTLDKSAVGLGNVGNTADATKNVLSATKLATARTIAISGAVTGTATSFDGTSNVTIPISALNVGAATTGTLAVARGGTGTTTSTGTGSTVLSASPTFTGTITAAAANFSDTLTSATFIVGATMIASTTPSNYQTGINIEFAASIGRIMAFNRSSSTYQPLILQGSSVTIAPAATTAATFSPTGVDITGEARCDTLRIDATPAASSNTVTHKVPVNLNGTVYYLLLSNS